MARFNLDDYETVESRLKRFWAEYPNGRVHTYQTNNPDDSSRYVFRCEIYTDREDMRPVSTGTEEEQTGFGNPVNKTSALANAETSAIGRALANFTFSGNKRPSREEMEKVQRMESAKSTPSQEQIDLVVEALEQINEINTMAELKNLYQGATEAGIAYINVNGKNIYSAVTAAKQRIEARDEAAN